MIQELNQILSIDTLQQIIDQYGSLGPIAGVFLPYIEAFLPFLPLTAFIMGNAASFGLATGFIVSYVGCVAGAWSLYWVCRYLGNKPFIAKYKDKPSVQKYTEWMHKKGILLVALLCMVPVFPNSVVTIVAGANRMDFRKFAFASAMGIFGMTVVLSFIGDDLFEIVQNPLKIIFIAALFFGISMVGKKIERTMIFNNG
ncbi:TVP38/TMEM64 family protein [Bacillus sp. 1P06AnD]|uniref:TVP38/TMEM64 family protein n=1 Tax=Bacillus sp. 1P06AnD TaxID=3132208 RepID=UPI0039A27568